MGEAKKTEPDPQNEMRSRALPPPAGLCQHPPNSPPLRASPLSCPSFQEVSCSPDGFHTEQTFLFPMSRSLEGPFAFLGRPDPSLLELSSPPATLLLTSPPSQQAPSCAPTPAPSNQWAGRLEQLPTAPRLTSAPGHIPTLSLTAGGVGRVAELGRASAPGERKRCGRRGQRPSDGARCGASCGLCTPGARLSASRWGALHQHWAA